MMYAGITNESFLCTPMHLNISNRHITATTAIAIGNTHVPERKSAGISTHKATRDVIILFNIKILSHSAKTSLTFFEIFYRLVNVVGSKIGPELVGEIKLGISRLPKEEV